jgi:hypothetical protein
MKEKKIGLTKKIHKEAQEHMKCVRQRVFDKMKNKKDS